MERYIYRYVPRSALILFTSQSYAEYALQNPRDCKVVAIAEPRPGAQRYFTDRHHIDPSLVFTTWQDLHAASAETITTVGRRLADAVIIAVQDQMHPEVTLAFAEQGYHILCEKPMAITPQGCILMERAVKKANIIFGMGHGNQPELTADAWRLKIPF